MHLTAADGMHDLDPITSVQFVAHVTTARHDFQIHLYGQTLIRQSHFLQQLRHRHPFRKLPSFTVHENLHLPTLSLLIVYAFAPACSTATAASYPQWCLGDQNRSLRRAEWNSITSA